MGVALAALLELTNSDAVAPQQQPPLDAQQEAAIKPAALEDQTTDPLVPPGFDCSLIDELGIDKQTNLRAGAIMIACGRAQGGTGSAVDASLEAIKDLLAPLATGGTDANLITGTETYPNVTQSTTFAAGNPDNPNEILVAYTDTRGRNAIPINLSGASLSTDGGNSFARLTAASGQSPFPNTYGDPVVLYNRPTATWHTVWLDGGCGGFGLGSYKSTTPSDPSPVSWTHYCVHSGSVDDRPSGWADTNPASQFYGRMYVSWNDFNRGGGAIFVRFSTDNGATWAERQITTTFFRNVSMTGDLATGAVYIAAMDEMGGGLTNRVNRFYKSTDGGNTWAPTYTGPTFPGPGRSFSGYFATMYNNPAYWRYMGWGQPAALNGVFHYVYAARDTGNGDPGNVFYIRSTDGGVTFSPPFMLNTDTDPTKAQWGPNLSVTSQGSLLAVWYDERERVAASCQPSSPSTPCYRMWARKSTDNGATWFSDQPFSDGVSPLPLQVDPGFNAIYAGDYDYGSSLGNHHLSAWVDGRVAISGNSQQDAFFDSEPPPTPHPRTDFDGDGLADKAVFRPGTGTFGVWYVKKSNGTGDLAVQWGASGDVPVAGNYAGDARADFAVFRPSNGTWWVLSAEGVSQPPVQWGAFGDVPVPGQYGGDTRIDFAVWRPSDGTWYVRTVEGTLLPAVQWGTVGDIPVPGDYDGDGVTDMAVFRPSTGTWFVKLSGGGTLAVAYGTNGDVPVAADFTGDGRADFAIFRPSTGDWFVRPSSGGPDLPSVNWGTAGDVALGAQMSGDVRADKVIWRPSSGIWYVESAEGTFPAPVQWGAPGDIAIAR